MSRLLMGCAVVVTMAAGCGGGLDLDDVEHRAIEAACTREVRCGYAPDVASCIDDTQLSPWYASYIRSLVAAAKAGAVTYDADAAAACFDLSATATCGSASTLLAEDPCAAMFRGTRATGATCQLDEECASGNCGQFDCTGDACCAGTCGQPIVAPGLGELCDDPSLGAPRQCATGLYCDVEGSHRCAPLVAAGAACRTTDQCPFNLACIGTPATCQALPVVGETCLDASYALRCDRNLVCDAGASICRPAARVGDACDPIDNICDRFGLRCGETTHVCELPPKLGQACSGGYPGYSGWCASHTYCDVPAGASEGTCVAVKADGASCVNADECASRVCSTEGRCVAPLVCF